MKLASKQQANFDDSEFVAGCSAIYTYSQVIHIALVATVRGIAECK